MWQARCRRRSPRSGTRSRCICHCTDPSTKRSTQSPGARSARARSRTVRPTRGSSTRRSCGMACAPSSSSMLGSVATRSTAIPTTRSGTRSSAELWSRISSTRLPTSFTPTTGTRRCSFRSRRERAGSPGPRPSSRSTTSRTRGEPARRCSSLSASLARASRSRTATRQIRWRGPSRPRTSSRRSASDTPRKS